MVKMGRRGSGRLLSATERERLMGFPAEYTYDCGNAALRRTSQLHQDARCSLIGNAFHVPVVAWLLGQLLKDLGILASAPAVRARKCNWLPCKLGIGPR